MNYSMIDVIADRGMVDRDNFIDSKKRDLTILVD